MVQIFLNFQYYNVVEEDFQGVYEQFDYREDCVLVINCVYVKF